jgi:hypothetical protein
MLARIGATAFSGVHKVVKVRLVLVTLTAVTVLIVFGGLKMAARADSAPDYSHASLQQLVDALVNVDAQTIGLHGTLNFRAFLADGSDEEVTSGAFYSVAPKRFPQMVELVRRGVDSLPVLIDHLNDARPTKLSVGNGDKSAGFAFMGEAFGDEYAPRARSPGQAGALVSVAHPDRELWEEMEEMFKREFEGQYMVKVGDVCYALIGQIVNRRLIPVRYQPTAILVVNSPVETPTLIAAVKQDWSGLDSAGLMASLLTDARGSEIEDQYGAALRRLRFYFPGEYQRQAAGELRRKIRTFEASERKK